VFDLLFLVALVIAGLFGHHVDPGDRFLVIAVLALCAGAATAAFGGKAAIDGKFDGLPGIGGSAPTIAVSGFLAGFLIVLGAGYQLYVRDGNHKQWIHLLSAKGTVTGEHPDKSVVLGQFEPFHIEAGREVEFVVGSETGCTKRVRSSRVEDPSFTQALLFVKDVPSGSMDCAVLVVTDEAGREVARSNSVPIDWSK
jgi:hypothetical protein